MHLIEVPIGDSGKADRIMDGVMVILRAVHALSDDVEQFLMGHTIRDISLGL